MRVQQTTNGSCIESVLANADPFSSMAIACFTDRPPPPTALLISMDFC